MQLKPITLPTEYFGQTFLRSPGDLVCRVNMNGQLEDVSFKFKLNGYFAVRPFFLFDVREVFAKSAKPKIKIHWNVKLNSVQFFTDFQDSVQVPSFKTYSNTPPNPDIHLQVDRELEGRFLQINGAGITYAVMQGGYLLAHSSGVYLSKHILRGYHKIDFHDVLQPSLITFSI